MKKHHLPTLILLTLFSGSLKTLSAQTLSDQENYIYQPQAQTPIGKPIGSPINSASESASSPLSASQGQPEKNNAPSNLQSHAQSNTQPNAAQTKSRLNEDDLRANPQLTEQLVNQALLERQWDFLAALLPIYQSLPEHNPTLYKYAHGAAARVKAKHRQAVRDFGEILQNEPNLPYVRLDYMAMLFENKQYRQAKPSSKPIFCSTTAARPSRFASLPSKPKQQ